MVEEEGTFAQKLNSLFERIRKPDGSQYTSEDVEKGTNGAVTRVYVWKLRRGTATNPGYQIIQALADFFKVDPGYFFPERESLSTDRHEPSTLDYIFARVYDLDDSARQQILNMMDFLAEYKGKKGKEDQQDKK